MILHDLPVCCRTLIKLVGSHSTPYVSLQKYVERDCENHVSLQENVEGNCEKF